MTTEKTESERLQQHLAKLAFSADDMCNDIPDSYIAASVRSDLYGWLEIANEAVRQESLLREVVS